MKYYDEQLWYEFMWWWMMMKWCGMMIDRRYPFCQSAGGSLPSASSLSEGPSPKKCIVMVTKLGGLSGLRVCPQRLFPRNHQVWIFRNRWLRAMLSESWWDLGKLSCCVGSVSVDPWTKLKHDRLQPRQSGCCTCSEQFGVWSTDCWLPETPCCRLSSSSCWPCTSLHV